MDDDELELLLALDGSDFEMAPDPHGISYAFVLRLKDGGLPWVRFDNAHAVDKGGRGYRRKRVAYDHWHRTEDDFWKEVRRTLDEKGIPNDL
jgi:hypothetical protein